MKRGNKMINKIIHLERGLGGVGRLRHPTPPSTSTTMRRATSNGMHPVTQPTLTRSSSVW
jgi:hypothetical protein